MENQSERPLRSTWHFCKGELSPFKDDILSVITQIPSLFNRLSPQYQYAYSP